jgi:hypothetical protein
MKKEGQLKTTSPQFKKWFGNSKVVDENGKPKVVYHGTDKPDFDIFDPASWFSDSPIESSAYAQTDLLKRRENALTKFTLSDDVSMAGKTVPYAGILSDHENPQVGKYYGTDDGVYKYLVPDIQFACVTSVLGMPSSVKSKLSMTRALDVIQSAKFGKISADWSYHQDDGLSITFTYN